MCNRFVRKKGETNERKRQDFGLFWFGHYHYWKKWGQRFFRCVVCEFKLTSVQTLVPPAGTYIYTILHRTDRQIHGSFELDQLARKQYHSWQNVRIIYLTERGKREKERNLVKKR